MYTPITTSAGLKQGKPHKTSPHSDCSNGDIMAWSPEGGGCRRTHSASASAASTRNATPVGESPNVKGEDENGETVGGEVTLKLEPGKPPKLARTTSHRVEKRAPALFLDYEDKTDEARQSFGVIAECTYAAKYLGTTESALECDCSEEWDGASETNHACGEDSDCINRATKMECLADCGCGAACQNQRFLRKQYAQVSVIKTKKKGYGLRADTNLKPNDFIFEYLGEVIGEGAFRRRMQLYDQEGIKHFYFMSLCKGEFVDATRKGNLGRFCNHSCNPNCYVDKWVVGDKLRMGIFAGRRIEAGEELVFNYNVDRYGADPQPCYCGEANCTGYIGGKTQTERGTKLSNTVIEALGIEDAESWDTAVARKPRKRKTGEDDEEYVNNVEPKGLDEDGVNKVMSSLMQCKEKWIAVKLLTRIQRAEDEKVRNRVVRFHGYRVLKTALSNFQEDINICLQVLDVLEKLPRLTRNKIQDSKIEETVTLIKDNEDERVASRAQKLLEEWSKLEMAYRIPRMKRTVNAGKKVEKSDRRQRSRSRSRERERIRSSPEGAPPLPTPRPKPRPPRSHRPPPARLPQGWFQAVAANGNVYYYDSMGTTTWRRPTAPATDTRRISAMDDQRMLQELLDNIVESSTANAAERTEPVSATPQKKDEKWRSLSVEKQKKLYESTLQPHLMHVVSRYKHKLPKEDLKRWAKEFAKQMVESDFRKGIVKDPTKISEKQAKSVKKHAQIFFDKAVVKKEEAEQRKKREGSETKRRHESEGDTSGAAFKKARTDSAEQTPDETKAGSGSSPPPPPPPPPPAADADAKANDSSVAVFSLSHRPLDAVKTTTLPTTDSPSQQTDTLSTGPTS